MNSQYMTFERFNGLGGWRWEVEEADFGWS